MATTNDPYRRIGTNSWEELLTQVNNELQDPPSGCNPIDPIATPDECHRWGKSDIREVHNKLDEMPTDCFTFQPIPDLWKISIIEDIENQLSESWCDCDEEQCCYDCPNCKDRETTFLGTETVGPDDCTGCSASAGDTAACNVLRSDHLSARTDFNKRTTYSRKQFEWCDLKDELEVLQNELDNLQDDLIACGSDPVCIAETQAEIDAKQIEVDDKQTEVDDANAAWTNAKATSDGACQRMISAIESMIYCDYTSVYDFAATFSEPIPPEIVDVCFDPSDANPGGPAPFCCGRDFWRCRAGWVIGRRAYQTMNTACNGAPLPLFDTGFRNTIGGLFDIDGTACPTNLGNFSGCTIFHLLFYCFSTNCGVQICGFGAACGHPDNDLNFDWEMRVASASCFTEFDCGGGPCGDGKNGF